MSDDYDIEVGQPVFYWAPPPQRLGPVKRQWARFRLWLWHKRGEPGWVPLGMTVPLDEEDYPR